MIHESRPTGKLESLQLSRICGRKSGCNVGFRIFQQNRLKFEKNLHIISGRGSFSISFRRALWRHEFRVGCRSDGGRWWTRERGMVASDLGCRVTIAGLGWLCNMPPVLPCATSRKRATDLLLTTRTQFPEGEYFTDWASKR